MKKAALIIFVFLSVAAPAFLFAQSTNQITISVNVPGPQSASAGPCGWISNFYSFALIISGILAFGAIVYGGVKYATSAGNPTRQAEGRSWINNALLGLLLLGGAYLILYTINPSLTNCLLPTLSPINFANTSALQNPNGGDTAAAATAALNGAGVTIKPGVSVEGMQRETVTDIQNLASACQQAEGGSCNIVVTSGTEDTHAAGQCSHANGYKADLRSNASLDSFITSQPKLGVRSDGATLYVFNGGTIADERSLPGIPPHWDLSGPCP